MRAQETIYPSRFNLITHNSMGILRNYWGFLSAFELLPLSRIFILGHPFHEVNPFFAPGAAQDTITIAGGYWFLVILARLGYVASPQSRTMWLLNLAMHLSEWPVFGALYYRNVIKGSLPSDLATVAHVVFATIIINPLLLYAFGRPSRKSD